MAVPSKTNVVPPGQAVLSIKSQSFTTEKVNKPLHGSNKTVSMALLPSCPQEDSFSPASAKVNRHEKKSSAVPVASTSVSPEVPVSALSEAIPVSSTQAVDPSVNFAADPLYATPLVNSEAATGMRKGVGIDSMSSGATIPVCMASSGIPMLPSASAYPLYVMPPMLTGQFPVHSMNMFEFKQQQQQQQQQQYNLANMPITSKYVDNTKSDVNTKSPVATVDTKGDDPANLDTWYGGITNNLSGGSHPDHPGRPARNGRSALAPTCSQKFSAPMGI